LCDILGIEVPIICAPFGPWEQVELAAAVCNAGWPPRSRSSRPVASPSAALVHDVAPAAALITRIVTEAEDALRAASNWVRRG
jgi:NAD(P)H-dependent flavin oxidoreductase YrpB (nitropropane dioxygenase family)